MAKDDFGNLLQGKGESSGILVAIAIGIFGILMLYTQSYIQLLSLAWWTLTVSYFFLLVVTLFAYKNWLWHNFYLNFYVMREKNNGSTLHEKVLDDISEHREKDWITKLFLLPNYSKPNIKMLTALAKTGLVLQIFLGVLLWVFVSFHCGIGDPINPFCSFPAS
jgi:hypothetical protein